MILRLFNIASALSLAIAVLAAASWVSSEDNHLSVAFHVRDQFVFVEGQGTNLSIGIVQGTRPTDPISFWLCWFTEPDPVQIYGPPNLWKVVHGSLWSDWTAQVYVGDGSGRAMPPLRPLHGVIVPWWAALPTPAILPALWLFLFYAHRSRTTREQSRRMRGLCPACAYDLRASTERCPECGTLVSSKASVPG